MPLNTQFHSFSVRKLFQHSFLSNPIIQTLSDKTLTANKVSKQISKSKYFCEVKVCEVTSCQSKGEGRLGVELSQLRTIGDPEGPSNFWAKLKFSFCILSLYRRASDSNCKGAFRLSHQKCALFSQHKAAPLWHTKERIRLWKSFCPETSTLVLVRVFVP